VPTEYEQLVEFLGRRFAAIDQQFAAMDQRFAVIGRRFDAMDRQFIDLREEIVELRREMLVHFDEIYRRLERLEQEYQAITQALRRIEAGLVDDRGRREILERDLAELKQHVAALQSRIDDLEQRLGR
jgi:chromosome segregation ATPase